MKTRWKKVHTEAIVIKGNKVGRTKNKKDTYVPPERKSLSPGISLGKTPLPILTGQRNLLISSEE